MVLSSLPPDEAAQTLVDLANLLGGPDNITAVVAEVDDPVGPRNGSECDDGASHSARPLASGEMLLFGGAIALAVLVAISAAVSGWYGAAAACGVIGLAVGGAWAFRASRRVDDAASGVCSQFGKGPYRKHAAEPSAENIDMLSDIVRQLEDLEDQKSWPFDWRDIHEDRGRALRAIGAGDHRAAVIAYSSAVRRLMQAVRDSRKDDQPDSGINLGRD
jgi:protein phosphatase